MANNIRISLRRKQIIDSAGHKTFMDSNVWVCAPEWVDKALKELDKYVKNGTKLEIRDSTGKRIEYTVKGMTIQTLQIIARAEEQNTSGNIDYSLYGQLSNRQDVILAIKDLVRQTIIVGPDWATHKGGYPNKLGTFERVIPPVPVVLIDLIALQFQQPHNTGRLVCISQKEIDGILDFFIFLNVVGEVKKIWNVVQQDRSGRYIKHNNVFFDTVAYQRFVAKDFLLVCKALHEMDYTEVNLKFLRYGLGFFAKDFQKILPEHFERGVNEGLQMLFQLDRSNYNKIKSFEFPFTEFNQDIRDTCAKYGVECRFSKNDALKQTHPYLMTATTNCGDPHAPMGNAMEHGSVDGAIAENVASNCDKFNPVINGRMKQRFIKI